MTTHTTGSRLEHDSLGTLPVLEGALWGIHTQRALENFPISGLPLGGHRHLVHALAHVKKAAALTNTDLGLIPRPLGAAIAAACDTILRGEAYDAFPIDVVQGGAGTSTNMNANEVIANLALIHLGRAPGSYEVLDPIAHVNRCQSTNDVYPTAVRLALVFALEDLTAQLEGLAAAFEAKGRDFASIPKIGRTQLQDAVPMMLGQEFTAFAVTIREDILRLRDASDLLRECSLGATAIGTGITAHPGYAAQVLQRLAESTRIRLVSSQDLIEATRDTGAFMTFAGALKRTAVKLSKISSDLRLLASGPQAGLAEITLPPRQAGSSIMPGKVNPVMPEVMNQIAFFVAGADTTVTMAAENGQLQLNAFEPAIAHALLQAVQWLGNGCGVLRELCVEGIEANEAQLRSRAGTSTAQATAFLPLLGYETSARLAHQALATGQSVADLAIAEGLLDQRQLDSLVRQPQPLVPRGSGGEGRTTAGNHPPSSADHL